MDLVYMNVSIIVPVYNPDKEILKELIKRVKSQIYRGRVEFLIIDEGKGFSEQMNIGIRKSKQEIIVILQQDCIPSSNGWLKSLVKPFKDERVIASVSKVELPEKIWDTFNYITQGIMIKERGVITSSLDGKGVAYRRKVIESIGLFDEKRFRTAGEDYDTYIKIKNKGIIAYPKNSKVMHNHPTDFFRRLKKDYQYANGYGALVRIHRTKLIRWWAAILKATPILGIFTYLTSYPWNKGGLAIFPAYLVASLIDHFYYIPGFWKGFIDGKQTVR